MDHTSGLKERDSVCLNQVFGERVVSTFIYMLLAQAQEASCSGLCDCCLDDDITAYKDAPELSLSRRRSSDQDLSVEKTLLVNPNCPVRIMLEYIRKKCKLGIFTQFDLCDENGGLKGLFNMPTYVSAIDHFEHKKTYYIIVVKQESDKRTSLLPQLNRENRLYIDLKARVKNYMLTGDVTPVSTPPTKTSPNKAQSPMPKASAKKK